MRISYSNILRVVEVFVSQHNGGEIKSGRKELWGDVVFRAGLLLCAEDYPVLTDSALVCGCLDLVELEYQVGRPFWRIWLTLRVFYIQDKWLLADLIAIMDHVRSHGLRRCNETARQASRPFIESVHSAFASVLWDITIPIREFNTFVQWSCLVVQYRYCCDYTSSEEQRHHKGDRKTKRCETPNFYLLLPSGMRRNHEEADRQSTQS